jgi:hypothetical protein
MTGEIVNLRKARKARARAEAQIRAAENRVRFGRSKAERRTIAAEDDRAARSLDGHRRDTGDTSRDTDGEA